AVALSRRGVCGHLRPRGLDGGVDGTRVEEPAERAGGQIVRERGELVVEIRQEELDAGDGQPAADRLHQLAALLAREADLGGALVDQARRTRAEARAAELLNGEQKRLLDALERSLRLGIELAQTLDVVADELEAERPGAPGRQGVEDSAPGDPV